MPDLSLAQRVAALDPNFALYGAPPGGNPGRRIVTGTGADWFGPQAPLAPIAPKEVAGRQWDYQPGWNLITQPRAWEAISFADLRALADGYDLIRTIIETRKDQMARVEWNIRPRDEKDGDDDDPRIGKIEAFLRKPDGTTHWHDWLRMLLEDVFVVDAPALWAERTRGGKLAHLHPIDGATIKRVIDDWGRTPQPPLPAYQQVLHGLPAVDYTARDIVYRPRNMRVHKVYGFSPVEQIIVTVNIALRRQVFQLQYYTEGNVPEALIGTPDQWTTDEIRKFQGWFDSINAGNTAERRRAKFVPGGVARTFIPTKEPELTGAMDEWLARVCCFAFSISPQPFIRMMNRATAESAHDAALSEGLAPLQQWVKALIDDVIETEFDAGDLEFRWKDDAEPDPAQIAANAKIYVDNGIKTINEVRGEIGLDPVPGGDQPVFVTPQGPVPVDPAEREAVIAPDETGANEEPSAMPDDGRTEKPAAPKPEVGKSAAAPFAKAADAQFEPLPQDDPEVTRPEAILAASVFGGFKKFGPAAADQVETILRRQALAIAPDDALRDALAGEVATGLDFSAWTRLIEPTETAAQSVGEAAGAHVAMQATLGAASRDELVNQVFAEALDYARARAAEMVGMKYDAAGQLAANPDARMAITETTREAIRALVVEALGPAEAEPFDLAARIAGLKSEIAGSPLFSRARAELIARAELAMAHGQGTLASFRAIAATGAALEKRCVTAADDDVESICLANEAAGWIGLEALFPSGDEVHPFHVRCRCATVARVKKENE